MHPVNLIRLLQRDRKAFEYVMNRLDWHDVINMDDLSSTFLWSDSPQGHDYWGELDTYLDILREKDYDNAYK